MSSVAARLERLPFCGFHKRLLFMGGLGYTFDAMDSSSMAFVLPAISKAWALTSFQTGLIASSTYTGFLFGALLAGLCGDRFGRRFVMVTALIIFCIASLISSQMDHWQTFYSVRIFAGFGAGAESAIVAPFLSEFVARKYRGAFTGALAGFFAVGYVLSAALGNLIIPHMEGGWRVVVVITSLPIFILLWWRRSLPESPRWLESRGRLVEANATLDRIEAQVRKEGKSFEPVPASIAHSVTAQHASSFFGNLGAIWSHKLRRTTAMSWAMWFAIAFSYYAFFTWIPSLLIQHGMTITKSFGFSLLMYVAQIPGYLSAAYLNERFGRQATIAGYMVLGGLSAVGMAMSDSTWQIAVAGICLSFFMNGTFGGVYAYTPEIFPTHLRATGVGTSSSFGRIGAVIAPIMVGMIYPVLGFAGVFGITTCVLLVGALTVLILGVPTRGLALEDISVAREGSGPADVPLNARGSDA
ncbi:MFS transporter [Paraburkholderia nemoris]|uniref:Niacin/nicotinamide transporter NaiP n=1 Tax=Paraburkholderia nemoris TaxID=2793076 RepID=A0ABN7N1S4_9BURK|nr:MULTISPECIES: MFS transporter [Paraburkholderia]MBK3815219.1 MFS transporter [Paraburkholderia aspalathi]CAE6713979.1 Putative niacin/nicotinamide transporter NaiP [Paraburkholderia nemoris]CAE6839752.1 Putative niacin/nicotinamide transporter NaiP [Paraburkholderia nemoris]